MKKKITAILSVFMFVISMFIMVPPIKVQASATGIISGGTYIIVNANSQKLLDCYGAGNANNTNVVQCINWGGTNQQWIITSLNNDYYKISPKHAQDKNLDVLSSNIANGQNVGLYQNSSSGPYASSKWRIVNNQTRKNFFNIYAGNSDIALATTGYSFADEVNVAIWNYTTGNGYNDEWLIIPVETAYYRTIKQQIELSKCFSWAFPSYEEHIVALAHTNMPFYRKFGISFSPNYTLLGNIPMDFCPYGYSTYCSPPLCNANSFCHPEYDAYMNHHKNFDHNNKYILGHVSRQAGHIRSPIFCSSYLCSGYHATNPGGVGYVDDRSATVNWSVLSSNHVTNVRLLQHEMSHVFGLNHHNPPRTCIMSAGYDDNYNYNLPNIWCSECISNFQRNLTF